MIKSFLYVIFFLAHQHWNSQLFTCTFTGIKDKIYTKCTWTRKIKSCLAVLHMLKHTTIFYFKPTPLESLSICFGALNGTSKYTCRMWFNVNLVIASFTLSIYFVHKCVITQKHHRVEPDKECVSVWAELCYRFLSHRFYQEDKALSN